MLDLSNEYRKSGTIGYSTNNNKADTMSGGSGRVERRCWVNFQCRGDLLVWILGQGPIALAVGAGRGCLDIFSLIYLFSFFSPSLWETVRYRLKYCLKGPLNPKTTNQPTMSGINRCSNNGLNNHHLRI